MCSVTTWDPCFTFSHLIFKLIRIFLFHTKIIFYLKYKFCSPTCALKYVSSNKPWLEDFTLFQSSTLKYFNVLEINVNIIDSFSGEFQFLLYHILLNQVKILYFKYYMFVHQTTIKKENLNNNEILYILLMKTLPNNKYPLYRKSDLEE